MSRSRAAKATAIACGVASFTPVMIGRALAQQAGGTLPEIVVNAPAASGGNAANSESGGYAANSQYHTTDANLGPLGNRSIQDTPASVTVVPQDLIVNQQIKTVNDTLRFLPSVEIR